MTIYENYPKIMDCLEIGVVLSMMIHLALVAQLDRVPGFEPGGRRSNLPSTLKISGCIHLDIVFIGLILPLLPIIHGELFCDVGAFCASVSLMAIKMCWWAKSPS